MDNLNRIICGDSKEILKTIPENSVDSIVADPPCGISFMSQAWDDDKGGRDNWIKWLSEIMIEARETIILHHTPALPPAFSTVPSRQSLSVMPDVRNYRKKKVVLKILWGVPSEI